MRKIKLPTNISKKAIIIIIVFAVVGTIGLAQTFAAPKAGKGGDKGRGKPSVSNTIRLYTTPQSGTYTSGQEFKVEIRLDSFETLVNGVDTTLTYQPDKLEFVRIDTQNSDFSVKAAESGGAGEVSIARGYIGSTSGNLLVAEVIFKPIASKGKTNISISSDSVIVDAEKITNVLQQTAGSSFRLN